ncbi:MAG TPA: zinc-dependent metalloprotease [Polyangiaceae bacterium]|jgi:hypothetical protein|nr:zinc-dependent metalloprotease [Polyangiaceae bacterium]
MRSKKVRWLSLLFVLCASLAIAPGCAQDRAPINRVQAGALDKSFFVGPNLSSSADDPEFYMGNRIIDEGYGVGHGFWLMQGLGSLARIKWEIQETLLIARLTYDRIQNSDYKGSQTTNDGQIIAEFTIESHFDIERDYNTQTGEQLNVIVENTTDRPWYERQYFRVDWSNNLITDAYDFDFLADGAAIDGLQIDPEAYYVQDPSDPNAPVFDAENGYFDVTTKIIARPQTVQTPYGSFPLCMLYGDVGPVTGTYPAVDCNPAEVTLRLSFKKVVDDDYEPENWDGNHMNAFGWFEVDRFGYDRNYGILDQDWHRFATKFNIWQQSHVPNTQCAVDEWRDAAGNVQNYEVDASGSFVFDDNGLPIPDPSGKPFTKSAVGLDVHRDTDNDGTEDECQFTTPAGDVVNPGSRCDEFTNKCDIPLYLRKTKTTPFYYGPTADPTLFARTAQSLASWNLAVKRASQLGKVVEANRAGVDVGQATFLTSEADLTSDEAGAHTVSDIFVMCHNPVVSGDSPACGQPGLAVRLGDLRYNVVDLITDPQLPSPWGLMTDFDDPLTGEKVQASVNEWGAVLDTAAQFVEDLLRWLDGEITNQQIANGQYLSDWVAGSQLGLRPYLPPALSQKEILSRLSSIDTTVAAQNGLTPTGASSSAGGHATHNPSLARLASQMGSSLPLTLLRQTAATNLANALGPSLDSQFESTRQLMLGSSWETELVTPDLLQQAGFDPTQPVAGNATTISMASPLQGLNPQLRRWSKTAIQTALTQDRLCVLEDEPEPDSLSALAQQAKQMFPLPDPSDPNYATDLFTRDQNLHQWLREQLHGSVIAHEMGHSMGLRHNFAGSFDALNYPTPYWQLRTNNGQEHYCGYPNALDATTPQADGNTCVGPRWVDPVTTTETNDFIWKYGSTTVMDYPGDPTQDTNDIGPYDKAAMRFGYADIVDVDNDKKYSEPLNGGASGSHGGLDFIQALDGFGGIFGSPIGGNHYSTYADKYNLLGTCTANPNPPTSDPSDPLSKVCSGFDLDYVAERDMLTVDKFSAAVTAVRPDLVANFAVDSGLPIWRQSNPAYQGRVRHPYLFGSDEFADVGNVPVFRFDAGADTYEQMQFLISTYEDRYVFDNFRRNRVTFNTAAVVSRIEDRYFDKIQALSKSLALGVELSPASALTDPGSLMPLAMGSADGFAMFIRALTRPAPGAYVATPAGAPGGSGPPNAWAGAWQIGDDNASSTPATPVNVGLGSGDGRYVENNYNYTQGYWWSEYQTQVGSYYEKLLAPMYLTEAYNQFISNSEDDYVDGRYKNVNYATIYPNQVRRLFANLMVTSSATQVNASGSQAQIFTLAPYAIPSTDTSTPNPTVDPQYLAWDKYDPTDPTTTSLTYPSNAVLLDPLVGWEEQYPSLVNLFWFGPTTWSMDLIDQMRIFSPGDAASLSIPDAQEVRYRDPLTGIEYVAKNYGTETVNSNIGYGVAKSVGARMLQQANMLAQTAYSVSTPPDPVTGELTYDQDAQGNAIPTAGTAAQSAATFLKGFTSNIDVVRQLTLFFGYGPLGRGQ